MNLNEFVEQTYIEFLREQETKEFIEIQENFAQLVEKMNAMAEWVNFAGDCYQLNEEINVEELTTQTKNLKTLFDALGDSFGQKPTASYNGPVNDMMTKPSAGSNVRSFLGVIIEFVKNLITRFIEWLKKVFSSVVGLTYTEPEKKADISFTSLMSKANDAQKLKHSFSSFGGTGYVDLGDSKVRNVLGIADEKVKDLVFNQINHESALTEKKEDTVKSHSVPAAYLDPSQDLFALKEALNHFFQLFEDSVGSSGERLFETTDVELLFKNFQAVYKALKEGDTNAYADIGGKLTKLQIVSPDRLKDNLIRTKINTDKLSAAYQDTSSIIQKVLQVIAQKNYQGAVIAPATFTLLSSASFKQMAEIVKVLDSRMKTAKQLEKGLVKIQDKYTKLLRELEKMRSAYMQLGSNYYAPSVLQKEISDLFVAGKYVMQTIMLRFSTLSLYANVLRETKNAIYNLNLINKKHGIFGESADTDFNKASINYSNSASSKYSKGKPQREVFKVSRETGELIPPRLKRDNVGKVNNITKTPTEVPNPNITSKNNK